MTRRNTVALLAIFIGVSATAAEWTPCDATITEVREVAKLVAIARCGWTNSNGERETGVFIKGEMSGAAQSVCAGSGYCGMDREITGYSASTTYSITGSFSAEQLFITLGTKVVTGSVTTAPPAYPSADPGGPFDQPSGGGTCPHMCTPIVVDLNDSGYEFSSAGEGVSFDIKADGRPVRVAWPIDPASVAFLFADRNGNGFPDDGSELFGNARRLRSGPLAANGFEALAEFDSDGDGTITSNDGPWNDLGLWFDGNRDGKGALSEVMTLHESGIVWLGIDPVRIGKHDKHGNMFHLKAKFGTDRNGKMKQRLYYDVYLTAMP